MIDKNITNTLSTFYKTKDLECVYDENKTKLTANNYNYVVSAVIQLDKNTDIQDNLLSAQIDKNYNDLSSLIDSINNNLGGRITAIENQDKQTVSKATSASVAASAAWADFAGSAQIAQTASSALSANQVIQTISFQTNQSTTQYYNGSGVNTSGIATSNTLSIKSILSAIHSEKATSASLAHEATSADNAIHSLTADLAIQSNKVKGTLSWWNTELTVKQFDGSSDQTVSSVLFSVSSQLAEESLYAVSADYDSEANPLNTKVEYIFSQNQNYDFPILFAVSAGHKLQSNQKYSAKYHEQINVNPYLGAIKANYFIGTAVSATYAVCDQKSNLLNTRVCQNSTQNNYNYPIALSFLNYDGKTPADGQNNELLYTANMRINPYNDIIFPKIHLIEEGNDIDYAIYAGNSKSTTYDIRNNISVTKTYPSYMDCHINFVGLATRAICDLSGYPINESPITYNHAEGDVWKPLIASTKSGYKWNGTNNLLASVHDKLTYSNQIIVNQKTGALATSGSIYSCNVMTAENNIVTHKLMDCGSKMSSSDISLVSHGKAHIHSTLILGSDANRLSNAMVSYGNIRVWGGVSGSTLHITGASNISGFTTFHDGIKVAKTATIGGATTISGATTIKNALTVTNKLTCSGTGLMLEVNGTSKFHNTITGTKFVGIATSAQWADLAQNYETDMDYPIGTLVQFGGEKQITVATNEANGVISDKPAYLMNSNCKGQPIALIGRVYVRVVGKANKFDYINLSDIPGVGKSNGKLKTSLTIGRALKSKETLEQQLLQCVIQLEL